MNVASHGRDGWPHLTALWYVMRGADPGSGPIAKSQKVKNLERDDRATMLVESGNEYAELKGVMLKTRAHIERDTERGDRLRRGAVRQVPGHGPADDEMREALRGAGGEARRDPLRGRGDGQLGPLQAWRGLLTTDEDALAHERLALLLVVIGIRVVDRDLPQFPDRPLPLGTEPGTAASALVLRLHVEPTAVSAVATHGITKTNGASKVVADASVAAAPFNLSVIRTGILASTSPM